MSALLDVDQLEVTFPPRHRGQEPFCAVRNVSFTVDEGQTVALVGESGSGKTTIGRAILGMTPLSGGDVHFGGQSIVGLRSRQRRLLARDLQVIFQDPVGSLNPARTIGSTIMEPLLANGVPKSEAQARVLDLLRRVNMPIDSADRHPGHFSGGQRQRVAIARALAIGPKLVICDEPTSALDVSTQAQVLELLAELRVRMGLSYLFITHDLAVVREFASHVLVLRQGEIVERGTAQQICESPSHSYTRALLAAAPVPDPRVQAQRRAERQAIREATQSAT